MKRTEEMYKETYLFKYYIPGRSSGGGKTPKIKADDIVFVRKQGEDDIYCRYFENRRNTNY